MTLVLSALVVLVVLAVVVVLVMAYRKTHLSMSFKVYVSEGGRGGKG